MSDLRDFTGKNRRFTGTDAETITSGTTGQRVDGAGKLRFNTTTNLMEYYDGTDWKPIDSPPTITNITLDGGSDVTSAVVGVGDGGNEDGGSVGDGSDNSSNCGGSDCGGGDSAVWSGGGVFSLRRCLCLKLARNEAATRHP